MATALNPQHEIIMDQIRGTVSPFKAAAISAIMYAEELTETDAKVSKLNDALNWIVEEICKVDPVADGRFKEEVTRLRAILVLAEK